LIYKFLVRPIIFLFKPETIHRVVCRFLVVVSKIPGATYVIRKLFVVDHPILEKKILGLTFKNQVGLAAGFDKNATFIDELADFGFSFVEIGTITPRSQSGNEMPRLFRLPKDKALINRMGFNNIGAEAVINKLIKRKSTVIVGANIGKNKSTDNDFAYTDYNSCFESLYPYVDYFVINVSSPNTKGLRDLQAAKPLKTLLVGIIKLRQLKEKFKPILLKISPDLTDDQLLEVIKILKETELDGVVATNTTTGRQSLKTPTEKISLIGDGGLSGQPLFDRSNEIIAMLRFHLGPAFPIIGVGGIMSATDALKKIEAGADLIQIYTGFVYQGPSLIKQINKAIINSKKDRNMKLTPLE